MGAQSVGITPFLISRHRLDRRDTLAMACEFGVKNTTLGIPIGLTVLGSDEMALPSAVYALVMYIPVAGVVAVGRGWFPEQSPVTHAA